MVVAFAYNVKKGNPSLDPGNQEDAEFDYESVINSIKVAIESLGHEVLMIEADINAFEKLKENKNKIDIVFNIAEGLKGDARESQIPIFCEMLGIPYTHSGPTTHAVKLDKSLTKKILKTDGILVPGSVVVNKIADSYNFNLSFPLIIKPNKEGSSKGIYDKNVVENEVQLKERLDYMIKNFGEELVEEYIEGREFTVSVLGNPPEVLPIVEQKFDFLPRGFKRIASYELKWLYEDTLKDLKDAYDCPAKLTDEEEEKIKSTSLKIFNLLNVRDCARIDYRMNSRGSLYFLEINTLPGINPDEKVISYFPLAARTAGLTFPELINKILTSAIERYKK